jgi:hypothetical protein
MSFREKEIDLSTCLKCNGKFHLEFARRTTNASLYIEMEHLTLICKSCGKLGCYPYFYRGKKMSWPECYGMRYTEATQLIMKDRPDAIVQLRGYIYKHYISLSDEKSKKGTVELWIGNDDVVIDVPIIQIGN